MMIVDITLTLTLNVLHSIDDVISNNGQIILHFLSLNVPIYNLYAKILQFYIKLVIPIFLNV